MDVLHFTNYSFEMTVIFNCSTFTGSVQSFLVSPVGSVYWLLGNQRFTFGITVTIINLDPVLKKPSKFVDFIKTCAIGLIKTIAKFF